MKNIGKIKYFLLVLVFVMPLLTNSQTPNQGEIILTANPQSPKPGESFVVYVQSYSTDLSRAEITWSVNGQAQKSGLGDKSIGLVAGQEGEEVSVRVNIVTDRGFEVSKSITITPATVELLWEADTYVPPFYEGKPAYTYRSPLKVVAIPKLGGNTSFQGDNDLEYIWRINGDRQGTKSGFGKNVLNFIMPKTAPEESVVSVTVKDFGGKILASNSMVIVEKEPQIVFYEAGPSGGVSLNNIIGGRYVLKKDELEVRAEPYFFTQSDINNGNLVFTWRVNRSIVQELKNKVRAVFGRSEDGGESVISLRVRNTNRILQKAFNQFRIIHE